jgi:NAD(P) transhydrogenase
VEAQQYDLVVIGAGPAGEKGAVQAAYFGKRVAVIEEAAPGGAVCHTGTLPSKTLRETALMLSGFRARDLYGADLSLRRNATVQDLLFHERNVRTAHQESIEENLARHGVDIHSGVGSFDDQHTIRLSHREGAPYRIQGEKILIAVGSSPSRPATFPFDTPRVWDSDDVIELSFMPSRMAIVGGGIIGAEYACTFAALGIDVTLIDGRTVLFPFVDDDVRQILERQMRALGVELIQEDRVTECTATDDGVSMRLESGRTYQGDAVLVAAGRRGKTDSLMLENAGLEATEKGTIPVNEHFQTPVPHIYGAGDVVGFPALASTSMEQARLAVVHAFDLKYKKSVGPVLPMGIFTIPEIGIAGQTEEALKNAGADYVVGRAFYSQNARGRIVGDSEGMLKLIFRPDDMRLMGVSVIGESATELVHVGLMALMTEATSEVFIETCFNYPTLGQLYKYATYDAMGEVQRRGGASLNGEQTRWPLRTP